VQKGIIASLETSCAKPGPVRSSLRTCGSLVTGWSSPTPITASHKPAENPSPKGVGAQYTQRSTTTEWSALGVLAAADAGISGT
jgi:hypothetical protein